MQNQKSVESFYDASLCLCDRVRNIINKIPKEVKCNSQEIRLRVNKNIIISSHNFSYFLTHEGNISNEGSMLFITPKDILDTFIKICDYSIYSFQSQIKNGYITFRGGHRAGICGTAILSNEQITNIRDISSINIRIAREIKGSADEIMKILGSDPSGTLLVGPPASGKTTLLRDISRRLSNREIPSVRKVTIVDERGEIGAVYQGVPQCDIGFCDIMDGYPKGIGILQAIRVLSPDIIICDEVGSESDVMSIEESLNAGVGIISSIHSGSIEELLNRKQGMRLINSGAFKRIILLDNRGHPGKIKEVYKVDELNAKNYRCSTNNISGEL